MLLFERIDFLNAAADIVIFGATGDLSKRMLIPSLYSLDRDCLLHDDTAITGIANSSITDGEFVYSMRSALEADRGAFDLSSWERFSRRLRYTKIDVTESNEFQKLAAQRNGSLSRENTLYYLALSPNYYATVCNQLAAAELNTARSSLVVEKPIGRDLDSSRAINSAISNVFDETQVFRVDHYLGKETVQNILALRFANVLFEPLWNKHHIDHVKITVFEEIGVAERWGYYNEYGALRDMVQNHVLQLLSLVAMEPPAKFEPDAVRDEKVKVIQSLKPIIGADVLSMTVRGQYTDGVVEGDRLPGYLEEAGGIPSDTETFVALIANIDNWRWAGVPFILQTGKRMAARQTEIEIQFKEVPHSMFAAAEHHDLKRNRLVITLQPQERVSLELMNKTLGLTTGGMRMSPLALDLSLTDAFHSHRRRIAYEGLFLDALSGNRTLFVRGDEIEASWKWVDGIAAGWAQQKMKVEPYRAGTSGPAGLTSLMSHALGDVHG